MTLSIIDVDGLDTFVNSCELRRDLHVFIDYVSNKEIKRSFRTNYLPKTDAVKLARLLTDPDAEKEIKESGYSRWVDYIDRLAWHMGFINYDLEGSYKGYSSVERSYPDNYIKFLPKKYKEFLKSNLNKQEQQILDTLIDYYSYQNNEFLRCEVLGRLDRFDYSGCATGVLPTLNFAKIRKFLLNYLANCESGRWYSVKSLINYLKKEQPYFLIPRKFNVKNEYDDKERYSNFKENKDRKWGESIKITEGDANAFERVEGRYVERFLEGIPLIMQYVDVAYEEKGDSKIFPSKNLLKAFRVKDRFLRVMRNEIPVPKVTVQPNFEIQVESDLYPSGIISILKPLTDMKTEDKVIILRLQKPKILEELVGNKTLDVISILKELTHRELPQNVIAELKRWTQHSETFTLYEGLGLLEGDRELPEVHKHTVETISPTMRIVSSPDKLLQLLEEKEYVPFRAVHTDKTLQSFPEGVRTVFCKKKEVARARTKKRVSLKCETISTLHFPIAELYNIFRKKLIEARCPFQSDQQHQTITLSKTYETNVKDIIKAIKNDYSIKIEEI